MEKRRFGSYYGRLGQKEDAWDSIWRELLGESPQVEDWVRFWRGAKALLAPPFKTVSSFRPELVFLALAESYAIGHSISLETISWLGQNAPDQYRLKLLYPPKFPTTKPLVVGQPDTEFDDYCRFHDFIAISDDNTEALTRTYGEGVVRRIDLRTGYSRLVGRHASDHIASLSERRLLLATRNQLELLDWNLNTLGYWELPYHPLALAPTPSFERVAFLGSNGGETRLILWNSGSNRVLDSWEVKNADKLDISSDGSWVSYLSGQLGEVHKLDAQGKRTSSFDSGTWVTRSVCAQTQVAECLRSNSELRHDSVFLLNLVTGKHWDLDQPPSKPADSILVPGLAVIAQQEGDFRQSCPVRVWAQTENEAVLKQRFRMPKPGVKMGISSKFLVASCKDFQTRIFSMAQTHHEAPLCRHDSTILGMCLCGSGRYLISWSTDQTVRLFDLETDGECLGTFSGYGAWPNALLSENARFLWVKSESGSWIYDLNQKKRWAGEFSMTRSALAVIPKEQRFQIMELGRDELIQEYHHECNEITSFACSPYGDQACSADDAGQIRVWDLRSGQTLHQLDFEYPIQTLSWSSQNAISFFPRAPGNFQYGWYLKPDLVKKGHPTPKAPSYLAGRTAISPNGDWRFEFGPDRDHPSQLLLSHQKKLVTLCWPQNGVGLFRGDAQILLGCDTGEILAFQICQ